jgi:hypothetical protein
MRCQRKKVHKIHINITMDEDLYQWVEKTAEEIEIVRKAQRLPMWGRKPL